MDAFFERAELVLVWFGIGIFILGIILSIGSMIAAFFYGIYDSIRRFIQKKQQEKRCAKGQHIDTGGCCCTACRMPFPNRRHFYKNYNLNIYPVTTYPSRCIFCSKTISGKEMEIGCNHGHIGADRDGCCTYCGGRILL